MNTNAKIDALQLMLTDLRTRNESIRHKAAFRGCQPEFQSLVTTLIDKEKRCHGFGRIRPCLLQKGDGWRIGPLMADRPELLKILLKKLIDDHPGLIIIDSPGLNNSASELFKELGFRYESETFRMYRGSQPPVSMNDVYGLACLELG